MAGVPRRVLLLYCRAGLLQPVSLPPYGAMAFSDEAIHAVRRIEQVRAVHGLDVVLIKTIFDLSDEVDCLRAEVRFLRNP